MKALKITLLIMAGIALLLGGSGYGCYRWVTSTMRQEPVAKQEGQRFGTSHDELSCALEAVARGKRCWGPSCTILTEKFLDACLAEAAPNAKLCDGVPPAPSVDAVTWPLTTCLHLGAPGDQACQQVAQRVMIACQAQLHRSAR